MTDGAEKRGQLIRHLEDALTLADEIEHGRTGYPIERALDEARSRPVRATQIDAIARQSLAANAREDQSVRHGSGLDGN
jgi:hypothetical protein